MKTYCLEITEEQASIICTAVELYSRIFSGQFEEILNTYYDKDMHNRKIDMIQVRTKLRDVKELLTGMARDAYHSIHSEKIPEQARTAWDLYQVIRYRLSWDKAGNPSERKYPEMMSVNFEEPLKSSKQPFAKMNELKSSWAVDEHMRINIIEKK